MPTTDSFPTTHALCPGGTTRVSPGPNSSSLLSSMTTLMRPDSMYCVWGASQLFVFTTGLTHLSQLHLGSSVILPIVAPFLNVVNSSLPLSNLRISSGEFIYFFSSDAIPVDVAMLILNVLGDLTYINYYLDESLLYIQNNRNLL